MKNDRHDTLAIIGAALLGAAMGAGAALLSREENRQIVKEKVADALEGSEEKIEDILLKAEELTASQRRNLITKLEETKHKLREEK